MLLSVFLADVTKEIDNTANDIHKNVFNRGDITQLVANYYVSVLLGARCSRHKYMSWQPTTQPTNTTNQPTTQPTLRLSRVNVQHIIKASSWIYMSWSWWPEGCFDLMTLLQQQYYKLQE